MKNLLKIIYLLLFLNTSFAGGKLGDKWIHITKKDGIDIYSKNSLNSPIKALRAQGDLDVSIDKIVAILRNVEQATDWVPNLIRRSYVENISDTEAILYDISDMPWPVKDRNLIVHHSLVLSEDKKAIVLKFKTVDNHVEKENKDLVRAKIHFGTIEFFPKKSSTFIRLTMLVDPMGKIPKWVVNLLQVSMPYEFLMSLGKFASKTDLKPLPGIQALLGRIVN